MPPRPEPDIVALASLTRRRFAPPLFPSSPLPLFSRSCAERYGVLQAVVPWTPRRLSGTRLDVDVGGRVSGVFAATDEPGVASLLVTPLDTPTDVAPVGRMRSKGTAIRLPQAVNALMQQSRLAVPFSTATMAEVRARRTFTRTRTPTPNVGLACLAGPGAAHGGGASRAD